MPSRAASACCDSSRFGAQPANRPADQRAAHSLHPLQIHIVLGENSDRIAAFTADSELNFARCNVNYSPSPNADHRRSVMRPDTRPACPRWHEPAPAAIRSGSPASAATIRRRTWSAWPARFRIRHTLAEMGAARLWQLLKTEPYVTTLGALTGNQAVQQVKAGLRRSICPAGRWRATPTPPAQMYPDQSLYPVDCVPNVVRGSTTRCAGADQIARQEGEGDEHLLDGADRGRRRSRLRRPAERLRADARDDRGRRRRRAFRGPAGVARRSAAISAARCWCRSASTSAR